MHHTDDTINPMNCHDAKKKAQACHEKMIISDYRSFSPFPGNKNAKENRKKQNFKRLFLFVAAIFILLGNAAHGGDYASLVTYGKEADTVEGDNDYLMEIYIRIPEKVSQDLFLRIFDADIGGKLDARYSKNWNTRTSFSLYGGKNIYPGNTSGNNEDHQQHLMAQEITEEDPLKDNQWYTFARFSPSSGEKKGNHRYFRLTAEGIAGDDGNRFLVFVSKDNHRNTAPEGLSMFTPSATINLPEKGIFAELRFFVPKDANRIRIANFDASGAQISLSTPFRERILANSSPQNAWAVSLIELEPDETGKLCAIRFKGGKEIPNDATFYAEKENGENLPIQLPIPLQHPNRVPEPFVKITPLTDCRSILFDASGTRDPEEDAMHFTWDFGDGSTRTGIRVTHSYQEAGTYHAVLLVKNDSDLVFNSVKHPFDVFVNQPPVADAGEDIVGFPGQRIVIDAEDSYDPDGRIITYAWDFGDGKTGTGEKIVHSYAEPDFYTVRLSVTDDSKTPCSKTHDEKEVWINRTPAVSLGKDKWVAQGEKVSFSGENSLDSDGKIISYEWDFGDGTQKKGLHTDHVFSDPGKYRVRLTVTDDSGVKNASSSDSITVHVNHPPVPDTGYESKDRLRASIGENIHFDPSGSKDKDGKIIRVKWDFGDGKTEKYECIENVSSCGITSHAYAESGTYQVILSVTDDSGTTTRTQSRKMDIVVNHPPTAKASGNALVTDSVFHADGSSSKDPDGSLISYEWDFGDGTKGRGEKTDHVYARPGDYPVRLTVTDDSGTSSNTAKDSMKVHVNHPPIADAGPDQLAAAEMPVSFDGSRSLDPDGRIVSYFWDFGDGATGKGPIISHVYAEPGVYNVQLRPEDDTEEQSGTAYDEAVVTINHSPYAICGKDILAAPEEEITISGEKSFDPDGEITSYLWRITDSKADSMVFETQKSAPVLSRRFSSPGAYKATLTVTDNSGVENATGEDTVNIRINHPPVANAGNDIFSSLNTVTVDAGESSDADGDPLDYVWDFGDGTYPQPGARVSHTYEKGGTYPVLLTVHDNTGLSNSRSVDSIKITINQPPSADAGGDRNACAGKVVIFDGSRSHDPENGVLNYRWDFGDGTSATIVNPTKTYKKAGIYPVTLYVEDDSGMQDSNEATDRILVYIAESPVAEAGPDQTVCVHSAVRFDGTRSSDVDGLVNSYTWDFGDGTTGGGPTPVHIYSEPGEYYVKLLITGDPSEHCDNTDTDELLVTVVQAGNVEIKGRDKIAFNTILHLKAITDAAFTGENPRFEWDMGDGNVLFGKETAHTYAKAGIYQVALAVSQEKDSVCTNQVVKKNILVNARPIADAGKDIHAGAYEWIWFDARGSKDQDGVIISCDWDFGDGTTGKGIQIRHRYDKPGTYTATLKVTDDAGINNSHDEDTVQVQINHPPDAVFTITTEGGDIEQDIYCPGDKLIISAGKSKDPDGAIASYLWLAGGTQIKENTGTIRHTFSEPGKYMISLMTDDGSQTANCRSTTTRSVIINHPPVLDAGEDRLVSCGEEITFSPAFQDDPDGSITRVFWDFGDSVTSDDKNPTHVYQTPGTYTVHVTAEDDSKTSCSEVGDTLKVFVNSPPVADAGEDKTGFYGGAHDYVRFDGSASFDPDGDPLTYSWDFGDGETRRGINALHQYSGVGHYTVTLTVDDGKGLGSSRDTHQIQVNIRKRQK